MTGPDPGPAPPGAVAGPETIAQVVFDLPVPRAFSYAVPGTLAGRLAVGQRVRAPFRGRQRAGMVVELRPGAPEGLEWIEAPVEPVPALPPALVQLGCWAAEETVSAWGEALARAVPPGRARTGAPASVPPPDAPRPPGASPPVTLVTGDERDRLLTGAIVEARGSDGGVLVLAPDIEAARAWAGRLTGALGDPVAVVTSAETPRQRWRDWWEACRGTLRVAVGTRAAMFLPLRAPGLIAVLDEEDPAHKALDAPRWHAREVALRRAGLEGARALLTAAAPSLETWTRVRRGEARAEAAAGAGWPAVRRIDLRGTDPAACLTPPLRDAVREALAARRPVLLLLNRVGYGRLLSCAECGAVRRCAFCRLALVYHQAARALHCRLCGRVVPTASLCPRCRGRRLRPLGWGTERLEAEARAAFPGARIARYDGTLPAERGAAVREAVGRREVDVLVGTRGALGLVDGPTLGLAALVLADTALNRPDFRAAERTLQLAWTLAERVAPTGSLWIQSFYPDHAAFEAVAARAPEPFYVRELAEREALGYPPCRRMALVVIGGGGREPADRLAAELAARGQSAGLDALGPSGLAGGRVQVVFLGDADLPHRLAGVLGPLRGHRRVAAGRLLVDIDPVELP